MTKQSSMLVGYSTLNGLILQAINFLVKYEQYGPSVVRVVGSLQLGQNSYNVVTQHNITHCPLAKFLDNFSTRNIEE